MNAPDDAGPSPPAARGERVDAGSGDWWTSAGPDAGPDAPDRERDAPPGPAAHGTADTAARDADAPRLSVRALACRRGDRLLFDGFDLDVRHGEIVWIRAANGFGKTTLLRALAGLGRPESGVVAWEGEARPGTVYLAHANALKDDLTVEESVRHQARLHRVDDGDDAVDAALRAFGLYRRRAAPVGTLSQGQRRRVALCRLRLSRSRPLWLLDEPYDALDADGTEAVGRLLADHAAAGGSVVLTSHVPPATGGAPVRTVTMDRPTATGR